MVVVVGEVVADAPPPPRNSQHPVTTATVAPASTLEHRRPSTTHPHSKTGTGFKHFPTVAAAKPTRFTASYWHALAPTLVSATAAYEARGAAGVRERAAPRRAPRARASAVAAAATVTTRLQSTRKRAWSNRAPAKGCAMRRSCCWKREK